MNQNFGLDVKRRPKHMSKQIFWIIFYKTHFCSKFPRRREYLEAYNWRAFRGQQYCLNWQNIYLALYFLWGGIHFLNFKGAGGTSTTMTNNLIQDSKSTTKDDKSNIFLFWEFLWFLFNRFFSTLFI